MYCSTTLVTGYPDELPANENSPYKFDNMYQETKGESEKLVLKYYNEKNLPVTVIRPAIVYGPKDPNGFVVKLAKLIKSNKFIFVGKGSNKIHFVHIENLIKAFIQVIEKNTTIGQVYIIADDKPIEIRNLVKIISKVLGVKVKDLSMPVFLAKSTGFVFETIFATLLKLNVISNKEPFISRTKVNFLTKSYFYDTSKAKKDFGYKPLITIENGMPNVIKWYVKNGYL